MTPHNCVILAVDTAAHSGWCVMVRGVYHSSGMVPARSTGVLRNIVKVAEGARIDAGFASDRAIVLVLEKPWIGSPKGVARKRGQHNVLMGLGGSRALWLDAWRERMGLATNRRVVSVMPNVWRQKVIGVTRGPMLETHERRSAGVFSRDAYDVASGTRDEAAAICIARWAACAPQVAKVLPKRGAA